VWYNIGVIGIEQVVMNLDALEKYEYWLDATGYDLDSADAMYAGRRWLYVVFMCQQSVEKLCKGLYTLYIDDDVPRLHNITKIVANFAEMLPETISDEQYRLFDLLTAFYIKGRYPGFKQKMAALLNEQEAKKFLTQTKEVFAWLQTMKP
jgi:HEPN domain-containing protein